MAPGDKRKEVKSAEGRGRGGGVGGGRGGRPERPAPQPARPGAPCRRRGERQPHSVLPPCAGPRGRPREGASAGGGGPRQAAALPLTSPPHPRPSTWDSCYKTVMLIKTVFNEEELDPISPLL